MARPKKLSDAEMVRIVETFFENHGNTAMLKCSALGSYAASLGIDVKAYDFRRSGAVRLRIEELKNSSKTENSGYIAYKSMDIDAMLNRNRTKEMMKNALAELDDSWRRIYEKAVETSHKNEALLAESLSKNQIIKTLNSEKTENEALIKKLEVMVNSLKLENRYLRKMLATYLYPAIANEILRRENILDEADTDITPEAMEKLTDTDAPSSFSSSVADDTAMLSQEELLLRRMRKQIGGGDNA